VRRAGNHEGLGEESTARLLSAGEVVRQLALVDAAAGGGAPLPAPRAPAPRPVTPPPPRLASACPTKARPARQKCGLYGKCSACPARARPMWQKLGLLRQRPALCGKCLACPTKARPLWQMLDLHDKTLVFPTNARLSRHDLDGAACFFQNYFSVPHHFCGKALIPSPDKGSVCPTKVQLARHKFGFPDKCSGQRNRIQGPAGTVCEVEPQKWLEDGVVGGGRRGLPDALAPFHGSQHVSEGAMLCLVHLSRSAPQPISPCPHEILFLSFFLSS
jgi:hypothetical protein